MREKKIESAPAWEVTWRTISDMVTGRDSVLLSPVALGSCSNGKPVKSVIGDTDVSTLAPPAPFDMRWLKVLNGRTPSSTALDATAAPRPCPGAVRDACGLCGGLDVPAHLLGDDDPLCPLAANAPVFRQMLASLWFRHGVPLLRNQEVSVIPREVRVAVGYRSGFVAAVKPARDAVPWKLLQESSAHERFQVRRDKIEDRQTTTALRTDRRLQGLLTWEKSSPGHLLHMDHHGTAAERARCRLSGRQPVAGSDDEDGVTASDEDDLRSEASTTVDEEPRPAESVVSLPDPYCEVPLDCPGYACNLRVSVTACLYAAWSEVRGAARRWTLSRGPRLWDQEGAEAGLCTWLQMPDGPAFADDLRVALLSVKSPDRRPHLANASVALQPAELTALGCLKPTMVLHWILSPELLPLVGTDVPVCGADWAWRFGCVPPCMLGADTSDSVSFLTEDCAIFCHLLDDAHTGGLLAGQFRKLWEHSWCIHVLPCIRGAPFGLDKLDQALNHPDSLLSFTPPDGHFRTVTVTDHFCWFLYFCWTVTERCPPVSRTPLGYWLAAHARLMRASTL